MDTAPRDGTPILIKFDREPFGSDLRGLVVPGFWSDAPEWDDEYECWFSNEWDSKPLTAFGARATAWKTVKETTADK